MQEEVKGKEEDKMMTRQEMKGIYALAPTPLTRSGRFDEGAFRENVRKLCKAGIHGIATTGTLGEFNTLPWESHQRLVEVLADETGKAHSVRSIAGCTGVNTEEAIKKTQFAENCGIDAVMNVVPFYHVLRRDEVLAYYTEVAEAAPHVGIIVYNNSFTGRVLHDAGTFRELSKIENVLGSKETTSDFAHWMEIVEVPELAFMHIDTLFVPSMMWGGRGCFSITACLQPELILRAYEASIEQRWDIAMHLQRKITDLIAPYYVYGSGYELRPAGDPSVYKPYVEAAGFLKCGPPGKPYLPIPNRVKKQLVENVRRAIERLG